MPGGRSDHLSWIVGLEKLDLKSWTWIVGVETSVWTCSRRASARLRKLLVGAPVFRSVVPVMRFVETLPVRCLGHHLAPTQNQRDDADQTDQHVDRSDQCNNGQGFILTVVSDDLHPDPSRRVRRYRCMIRNSPRQTDRTAACSLAPVWPRPAPVSAVAPAGTGAVECRPRQDTRSTPGRQHTSGTTQVNQANQGTRQFSSFGDIKSRRRYR
ncbi:hypothetical protein SAMN05444123_101294 [Rhodopseudomonas pseudopalustris]|uniref:Uncharacterized protein n=1 Tax=Rhodopseudomonas pseudopalustris TaxID=1513892 RepID=A0A1H8LZG0_9BRAD|nr:hypothetical protein SAMN05444123_101294 [Rhodopseudomonas pseudopalustris]